MIYQSCIYNEAPINATRAELVEIPGWQTRYMSEGQTPQLSRDRSHCVGDSFRPSPCISLSGRLYVLFVVLFIREGISLSSVSHPAN